MNEGQGRKSAATDDLVKRVRANRRFTINALSIAFPDMSISSLYSIIKEHLCYNNFVLTILKVLKSFVTGGDILGGH